MKINFLSIIFGVFGLVGCSQYGEPQDINNPRTQLEESESLSGLAPAETLDYSFIRAKILDVKCISCHKADGKADQLIFSTRDEMLKLLNEDNLPMIVPGRPEQSLLYLSLLKDPLLRKDVRIMPPKKAVSEGLVADVSSSETEWVRKWIEEGAR